MPVKETPHMPGDVSAEENWGVTGFLSGTGEAAKLVGDLCMSISEVDGRLVHYVAKPWLHG